MSELVVLSMCRGLCVRHYHVARGLIRAGRVTWEALEKNGKSLPAGRAKETQTAWFLDRMAKCS